MVVWVTASIKYTASNGSVTTAVGVSVGATLTEGDSLGSGVFGDIDGCWVMVGAADGCLESLGMGVMVGS